jgi:putative membrane protein
VIPRSSGPAGALSLGDVALTHWTFEPFTILLLLFSAVWYARGVGALWGKAGRGRGVRGWEVAAFGAGLLSLGLGLLSPLAWVSQILFSAHMTQHELLMLVSAPLLVFGRPFHACFWAFSLRRREWLAAWARSGMKPTAWHALTGPAAACGLHALALWVWHVPAFYEAALRSEAIHALQHASFVLTAALFWWGVVEGRYGRAGYGVGVLYVFLTAVHSSVLGALMTVAPSLWYPSYAVSSARWQIDALEDQQLAGLVMWVPSGVVWIVFGLALLAAWLGESERRARLGSVSHATNLATAHHSVGEKS